MHHYDDNILSLNSIVGNNVMNKFSILSIVLSCMVLTACATTPQEKAAHAQEKAERRLALQVKMAQQCDPVAARLMQELPTVGQMSTADKTKFNQQYQARVNNPTFKACYNLAFENYNQQQQLEMQQMEWDTNAGWFNNEPFNCEFSQPMGPFWGAC